jgi:GT2 family glycosyltransferase
VAPVSGPTGADLSIVIPTYGREEVLMETVRRVLVLDPPPAELLVVDQTRRHSEDVERELTRLSVSGAIAWIRLAAPSIPRAMNAGLLRARSDVVLFLDDDVIPAPGLVAAHLAAHRDSGAAVVAGQVLQPGEEPEAGAEGPFRFRSAERRWVTEVMGGNFSIRRELAIGIGGMDENFVRAAYGFEAELCQRARARGAEILFEPRASIRHLRAPSGGTRAWGHHLRTARPGHSVGAFYRILRTSPRSAVPARFAERLARSVRTRHHRSRPWWIPVTLTAEIAGLAWATVLALRGPRLIR